MADEESRRRQFAEWLTDQLRQRGWTQGRLILQSGSTDEERLSSAAVSRYSTGKMLPDVVSCQKIARAFGLPIELVLRKAGLIVDAGQLPEEGRLAIIAQIRREQRLQELERKVAKTGEISEPGTST